jgi:SAM-dependent methyltransferase
MNYHEIERMRGLEDTHWWYRGLRDVIAKTLRSSRFHLPESPRVLDAGCGTGANLQLLREELTPSYLGGFDLSPEAVHFTHARRVADEAYISDICKPVCKMSQLDLILCCDVLSIAGIQAARNGLRRLTDALKRKGLVIFNMPAYRWLNSSHDVSIGTRDRVTTKQFSEMLKEVGLQIELLTYRVFTMFPLIVAARLPSIVRGQNRPGASDLKPVSASGNALLSRVLFAENDAIVRGISFPWGSSVYAVARKQ